MAAGEVFHSRNHLLSRALSRSSAPLLYCCSESDRTFTHPFTNPGTHPGTRPSTALRRSPTRALCLSQRVGVWRPGCILCGTVTRLNIRPPAAVPPPARASRLQVLPCTIILLNGAVNIPSGLIQVSLFPSMLLMLPPAPPRPCASPRPVHPSRFPVPCSVCLFCVRDRCRADFNHLGVVRPRSVPRPRSSASGCSWWWCWHSRWRTTCSGTWNSFSGTSRSVPLSCRPARLLWVEDPHLSHHSVLRWPPALPWVPVCLVRCQG